MKDQIRKAAISTIAIKKSKNNIAVHAKLMLAFKVTNRAVAYWFKKSSDKLTTATAVAIIKEETGLTEEQILHEPKPSKKNI